jgi:hypothetical protein
MNMKKLFWIILCAFPFTGRAQNDRLQDNNSLEWAQLFTTVKLSPKWDALVEYQWRRTNGLKDWQQSLFRTGIQRRLNNQLTLAAGYAWIETFPYGDYPLAANGTFPEHRIHEQIQLRTTLGKLTVSQRLRIEQRWLGRVQANTKRIIEDWVYSNRFRHLVRLQHPLVQQNAFSLYGAVADEIFIGAGKNVGANVFDQNRIMLILGSKLSNQISIEAGYINQTLFQGRRVNNNTIVQNNNGATLALIVNL